MTRSAGRRLRADLDQVLAAESDRLGGAPLRWDPRELTDIEAACAAADNVTRLQRLLNAELRGDKRPTVIVKYAAEARLQRRAVAEHLGHIQLTGLAPVRSAQHSAAARARWGPQRPRRVS